MLVQPALSKQHITGASVIMISLPASHRGLFRHPFGKLQAKRLGL